MIKPTIFTWIIAIFGIITFLPLMLAQIFMLIKPHDQKTKDLIIGKGEDWRDKTHLKSALAFAWADWLVIFPLLSAGTTGALLGHTWGYFAWLVLGVVSIYFSIVFWIMEKEYTHPSAGWLAYYTYFWGFFLYWGIAAVVYPLIKLL
jgi:hypothetical protein